MIYSLPNLSSSRVRVSILCILFFAGVSISLRYQLRESIKLESIFRQDPDVDELDFHFMAVNFALKNEFPVIGYLTDTAAYKIRYEQGNQLGVDVMYLNMFRVAGPVHTFARPPAYSFVVGLLYKIFGFHLFVLIWFNILLVAGSAAILPYLGYRIWGQHGLLSGMIASLLFLLVAEFSYVTMDVEILASFLFLLMFYLALLISKKDTPLNLFCLGLLVSIEFLNKPVILFFLPLYLIFYYFDTKRPRLTKYLNKISFIFIGLAIVILPWTIYINYQKSITIEERRAWSAKTYASLVPPVLFNSKKEIDASQQNTIHALKNFIKIIYIYHTEDNNSPMLITNQFREGVSLLFLNNEYCVDNSADMAGFGWLWKIIKTSYYNTHHLSSSNVMKVFYFYWENPSYIYKIAAVRIKYSVEYPLIFWLAPALWALALISIKAQSIKNKFLQRSSLIALLIIGAGYIALGFGWPLKSEPLWRVAVYLPAYITGILIWKKEYNRNLSGAYPIFWLSIFLFILLVYGDQRFTKAALGVNCFAAVFYIAFIMRTLYNFNNSNKLS